MPVSPLQYLLCNFLTDLLAVSAELTNDKIPVDIEVELFKPHYSRASEEWSFRRCKKLGHYMLLTAGENENCILQLLYSGS